MPIIVAAEGEQTAVIDTPHTLATITDAGIYLPVVDQGALVKGDRVFIRQKTKVRTGGTSRLAYGTQFSHAQADPNKYGVPVPSDVEYILELEQTDGTGRAFPWKVYKLSTPAVVAEGTMDEAVGTELTLATLTVAGAYVLVVDTGELVLLDRLEARHKTKVRAGNTLRVAYFAVPFSDPQAEPNKYSVPVPADTEYAPTLKQTDGTARDFPWKIYRV